MKVPLSWLQESFARPLDPAHVAERLTLAGIEVERIAGVGAYDPLVVAARIESAEPADRA